MRTLTRALSTVLALAPLLGACAAGDGLTRYRVVSVETPTAPPLAEAVAPGAALAALPREAGAVVSVVQTRRTDGIDQKITLVGDSGSRGDNVIDVTTRRRNRNTPVTHVDETAIQAEMAERLPGVAMSMTTRVVVSASGPIGVATGRPGPGAACLYAWSTGGADRSRGAVMTRALGIDGAEGDDLQVRVRLCRQGASEEQLIALAEGLRIDRATGSTSDERTYRPVGNDALASAGFAGSAPPLAAPTPIVRAPIVEAPVWTPPTVAAAPVTPAPRHTPARTVAAKPAAPRPALEARATPPQPSPPTITAAPIPLPSGG